LAGVSTVSREAVASAVFVVAQSTAGARLTTGGTTTVSAVNAKIISSTVAVKITNVLFDVRDHGAGGGSSVGGGVVIVDGLTVQALQGLTLNGAVAGLRAVVFVEHLEAVSKRTLLGVEGALIGIVVGDGVNELDVHQVFRFTAEIIQRVSVGWAFDLGAVSAAVSHIAFATVVKVGVPRQIIRDEVVEVGVQTGGGEVFWLEGNGGVLCELDVGLADAVAVAVIGARGTLASSAGVAGEAGALTGGAVAQTHVGALLALQVSTVQGVTVVDDGGHGPRDTTGASHGGAVSTGPSGHLHVTVAGGVDDDAFVLALALVLTIAGAVTTASIGALGSNLSDCRCGKEKGVGAHLQVREQANILEKDSLYVFVESMQKTCPTLFLEW